MRKVLTLLILLSLFVGIAGAANVTISKTPTFNWGPSQGMKNAGTIQAGDLYATDDLLVAGDAEVIGTLYVGILNAGANITSGHLTEDTTIDAGVDITAASGDGAFDYSLATGAFITSAGAATIGPGAVGISGDATFSKTVAYSLNATTTVSTTIDATATKTVYGIDASGGHVTFTLPDASTVTGRLYMIATAKDMAANNIIVATAGAGKIGGESGADTLTSTDATAALSVISDGTHYLVTSKVGTWT